MINDQKEEYYIKKPMSVADSSVSIFFNRYFNNPSRIDIAGNLNFKGSKCLDLACGEGALLNKYLNNNYKECIGVDISPKNIKVAKKNGSSNTSFFCMDIFKFVDQEIKLKNKYDAVFLLAILEHIMWPSEFLIKLNKIVKKGGVLVIETPNVGWFPYRFSLLGGKFPMTAQTKGVIPGIFDEHIRFFTFDSLKKIISEAGFKYIGYNCSGKFGFFKKILPSILSADIFLIYEKK